MITDLAIFRNTENYYAIIATLSLLITWNIQRKKHKYSKWLLYLRIMYSLMVHTKESNRYDFLVAWHAEMWLK